MNYPGYDKKIFKTHSHLRGRLDGGLGVGAITIARSAVGRIIG